MKMWYKTTVFVSSYMGNFHPQKFGKYYFLKKKIGGDSCSIYLND